MGTLFQSLIYATLPLLQSHDLMRAATKISLVMLLCNVILDLLLIPRCGAWGAAVATATTAAVGGVLHLRLAAKRVAGRGFWSLVAPAAFTLPLVALALGWL